MKSLTLELNGAKVTCDVEPRETLADFLRDHCRLTATHLGCEHGACGACTVAVTDKPLAHACDLRSCVTVVPCRRSKGWTTIPQWKYCVGISINRMPCSAGFARPGC